MRKKSIRKNKSNRKKTYRKKTNRKEKYHKKINRKRTNHKKTKHKKTYLKKRNIQRGGEKMNDDEFKAFYQEFTQRGLSNYGEELEGSFTMLKQQMISDPEAFKKLIQNLIDVLNDENYRTIIIFILQLVIEIRKEYEVEDEEGILVEPLKRFFDSDQFQMLEISKKKGTDLYKDITGYDYQETDEAYDKHLESYMNDIVQGATMEFQNYDDSETKIKFYEQALAKIDEDNLEIKKDLLKKIDELVGLFDDNFSLEEEIEKAAGDFELKQVLKLFHTASQESMDKLEKETEETVETARRSAREEVGNNIYLDMKNLINSLGITEGEIDGVDPESEDFWIEMINKTLEIIEKKIKGMQEENEGAIASVAEAEYSAEEAHESLKKLIEARDKELEDAVAEAEEKGKVEGYEEEKRRNKERLKEILKSVNELGSVTRGESYVPKSNTEDIESTLEEMVSVIEGNIKQEIKSGTTAATAAATKSLMEAANELQELSEENERLQAEANEARATRDKAKLEKDSALESLEAEESKNLELIARNQEVVNEHLADKEELREQNRLYELQNKVYRENNTELKAQNEKLSIDLAKKEDCIERTKRALGGNSDDV